MTERGSLACNGDILIWHGSTTMYIFDLNTGIRIKKERLGSEYISCYDAKENWYYYMDVACYSWLKRIKVRGFEPKDPSKKKKKVLPELPVILDSHKSTIQAEVTS